MLTDPAAAAWEAYGTPDVDAPPPTPGRCGRCGSDGDTVTSSRIVSEKFTGYDAWPYGTRRLCVPCAWAYTRLRAIPTAGMLITATTVTEYTAGTELAAVLTQGPLTTTQAVIVPGADPRRRRHILPTAQWGHAATDGLVVRWDDLAAQRLTDLAWLRTEVGATWPQLQAPLPSTGLLAGQPGEHWTHILTAWKSLHRWRILPPLWAAARTLTEPTP